MIKYPNGKQATGSKVESTSKRRLQSAANRGMSLEQDINLSNEYYKNKGQALITKRPTPVNVVKVDYEKGARIIDAYFEKQSTTDYNGVYQGKYIDFEAKSTNNKTSFPLNNISKHQIEHLKNVLLHGGICFFIIEFSLINKLFLLDAKIMIEYIKTSDRKSIPLSVFKEKALELSYGFSPRIDYLSAVKKFYNL